MNLGPSFLIPKTFVMISGKFLLAVLAITVAVTLIQWLIVGFLFHKYQAITPMTWRKETSRSYAASTILSLLFSFMFTLLISLWMRSNGPLQSIQGLEFGALCWLTFAIPLEIGASIYVNYSRMFVAGKCLSALAEYLVAGWLAIVIL
jgi:hypothetical protein